MSKILAALSTIAGIVFGLVTYEIVTLVVASVALAAAVISLILGTDNRRDLKTLIESQSQRSKDLVEGLEGDVAPSGD
jgi:hypothetical protein